MKKHTLFCWLMSLIMFFAVFSYAKVKVVKMRRIEPINNFQIKNLSILCRVWEFLKYFHPAIKKGGIDWDEKLVAESPQVLKVKNIKGRDTLFLAMVKDLGDFSVFEATPCSLGTRNKLAPYFTWINDENLPL